LKEVLAGVEEATFVGMASDCIGADVEARIRALTNGQVH